MSSEYADKVKKCVQKSADEREKNEFTDVQYINYKTSSKNLEKC